jgi:predicted transcriptional regulator
MSIDEQHGDIKPRSNKLRYSPKIENLLDEINYKGIFEIAQMNEKNQVTITKWARDIYDRYESVL